MNARILSHLLFSLGLGYGVSFKKEFLQAQYLSGFTDSLEKEAHQWKLVHGPDLYQIECPPEKLIED